MFIVFLFITLVIFLFALLHHHHLFIVCGSMFNMVARAHMQQSQQLQQPEGWRFVP